MGKCLPKRKKLPKASLGSFISDHKQGVIGAGETILGGLALATGVGAPVGAALIGAGMSSIAGDVAQSSATQAQNKQLALQNGYNQKTTIDAGLKPSPLNDNIMTSARGGFVPIKGRKHKTGGINVDQNGNPTASTGQQPVAEVEGGETIQYPKGNGGSIEQQNDESQPFVFSDQLKINKNDTYADKSKKINRKYDLYLKDGRFDPLASESRDSELNQLKAQNIQHKDLVDSLSQPQDQEQEIPMGASGIHIKKSHEGRFTAYKKRTGQTTEEALHSSNPHVRQMANFARNAKKWKHDDGGMLMDALGGPFDPVKDGNPLESSDSTLISESTGNGEPIVPTKVPVDTEYINKIMKDVINNHNFTDNEESKKLFIKDKETLDKYRRGRYTISGDTKKDIGDLFEGRYGGLQTAKGKGGFLKKYAFGDNLPQEDGDGIVTNQVSKYPNFIPSNNLGQTYPSLGSSTGKDLTTPAQDPTNPIYKTMSPGVTVTGKAPATRGYGLNFLNDKIQVNTPNNSNLPSYSNKGIGSPINFFSKSKIQSDPILGVDFNSPLNKVLQPSVNSNNAQDVVNQTQNGGFDQNSLFNTSGPRAEQMDLPQESNIVSPDYNVASGKFSDAFNATQNPGNQSVVQTKGSDNWSDYNGGVDPSGAIISGGLNAGMAALNAAGVFRPKMNKLNATKINPRLVNLSGQRINALKQANDFKRAGVLSSRGLSGSEQNANILAGNVAVNKNLSDVNSQSYGTEENQNADIINRANMFNAQNEMEANQINNRNESAINSRQNAQTMQYLNSALNTIPQYMRENQNSINNANLLNMMQDKYKMQSQDNGFFKPRRFRTVVRDYNNGQ